jgi:hypothetical protein
MKNARFRSTTVLLLLAMTISLLLACGDSQAPAPDAGVNIGDTPPEAADGEIIDEDDGTIGFRVSSQRENIPDSNFGGRDFTILIGCPEYKVWTYTNMVVEEMTGDTIDDAYYKRNRIIEDRLNINIKQIVANPLAQESPMFRRSVDSGDNSFDISLMSYGAAANLAISNYCLALNEVDYLDFDKPWWDRGSLRDLSIGGRTYLMASDMSIGDNDNTWLIYFDKQHVQDHGLTSPYLLVEGGKWTFDAMFDMMREVSHDVDGDGRISIAGGDRFGLLTHGENYAGMWIAAGQRLIGKDSGDLPYISFGTESFVRVWEKIVEIMGHESCNNNDIPFISSGLRDGHTLFGTEILKFVRDYRENEREFGILPMPKFNEAQESYYTYVAISAPLLIVPISHPDVFTAGIIIEAMAAEGHRTIMPAYYEVSIEGKFVRDEESIAMLDIAFDTRMYDLGVVFNWGNVNSHMTALGNRRSADVMSMLEQRRDAMQAAIDRALDIFEAH